MFILRQSRKYNLQISRLNSPASLLLPSHGGVLSILSLVYASPTPPSHPSAQAISSALDERECLISVFASKYHVPNIFYRSQSYPDVTTVNWSVSFQPKKVDNVLSNLNHASVVDLDGISVHVLKSCSAVLTSPLSAHCNLSSFVLFLLYYSTFWESLS